MRLHADSVHINWLQIHRKHTPVCIQVAAAGNATTHLHCDPAADTASQPYPLICLCSKVIVPDESALQI